MSLAVDCLLVLTSFVSPKLFDTEFGQLNLLPPTRQGGAQQVAAQQASAYRQDNLKRDAAEHPSSAGVHLSGNPVSDAKPASQDLAQLAGNLVSQTLRATNVTLPKLTLPTVALLPNQSLGQHGSE